MRVLDEHIPQIYVDATEAYCKCSSHCVRLCMWMSTLFFTCREVSGFSVLSAHGGVYTWRGGVFMSVYGQVACIVPYELYS